jgi:hypothetical protein
MSVMPAISDAHAAPSRGGSCPAAESLVPATTWHHHRLAPGVTLTEGRTKDHNGTVKMHVLRVTMNAKGLSVAPLVKKLAARSPLTQLAAGHRHLVAAINTGYFDFYSGAPLDPLIVKKVPLVISPHAESVVGLSTAGTFQAGSVWIKAEVYAGTKQHVLTDVNEVDMRAGVGVYTTAWGSQRIPSPWNTVARPVIDGKVGPPIDVSRGAWRGATVPSHGYLLVAKHANAERWLKSIKSGTKIGIAAQTRTNAPHQFVQAYGVGVQLVAKPGTPINGFSCDSARTKQPARTAIGFANGGRTLILAEVEDHPGTSLHGLDNDQMSKLMVQLGAGRAYDFDGSGSTEMLARMPKASSVGLRTYPADGAERAMPVGFGVFSKKVG